MSQTLELILNAFTLISETPSRLEKDKIMKGLLKKEKTEKMLREILQYTFHPYWNYWVKVKSQNTLEKVGFARDIHWVTLKSLLDKLRNREITGNDAKAAVEETFMIIDSDFIEPWFRQIINRDLKIGMQLRSFEKHLGEEIVPKFSPMLSGTWDGEEIKEEIAIEPKLDGLRCFAIFPNDEEPTTVSRNGRPIYNTEKILDELKEVSKEHEYSLCYGGVVFDTELIGSEKSWGSGVSAAHSKNKKVKGLTSVLLDIIPFDDWVDKSNHRSYVERRSELEQIEESRHIKVIPILAQGKFSSKQIKKIAQAQINIGGEGIMIKPVRKRYMFKRSDNWLKFKYEDNVDCRVVGRIEGNHRNKGKLGALIVEGVIDGQKFRSEVGQGFSDEFRKKFWKMKLKDLTQLVIEVKHYGLTGSLRLKQSDKLPAIRNGIFLQIREDKMER